MSQIRFFLNVLDRTVPLIAALLLALYAPNDRYKEIVFCIAIVVLLAAEYAAVFRPMRDWGDSAPRRSSCCLDIALSRSVDVSRAYEIQIFWDR